MRLYQINSLLSLSIMHTTLPFLFILLISPILVESSFTPSLTSKSTSAFIDGQYFYILGSTPSSNDKISQAFMINLSTQWDAKTPDFTELSLPTSGLIGNSISSTLTLDQQRWFVVSNNKGYYYDIKLNTWSTSTIKLNGPLGLSTTITNNKDGSISIIDSNNGKRGSIWTLDPNSNNTSSSSLFIHKLSTDKGELIGSSLAAWSNTLSKLILFDSSKLLFTAEINKNNVNAGNSQNNYGFQGHGVTFSPHMFTSACFVPAGNGSKIIYFGGSDVNNKPTGDVSILDTTTWTWNTIRSTDIQKRRVGASCAVSNNQLIIWGGYNSKTAIPNPKEVLIFDLTTNQWIDRYTPPTRINSLPDSTKGLTSETATPSGSIPDPLNQGTNGPAPVASEMSDSNNSSTGPSRATRIGLGVLAVLVVLAIVGAIFLCVRKRKLKKTLRRTQFWDSTGNLPLSAASSVLGVMSRNNKVTPVPPPVATKEQKQEMQQQHLQQQQQQQQQPHNQSQQTIIESPPITPRNSPKENLEYLNVSDTDDASTLNDNPSPLYPPTNFCNDSFWSVTVSLSDKQDQFEKEEQEQERDRDYDGHNDYEHDYQYQQQQYQNHQVYPIKKETFAFPIPPSSPTMTLEHALEPATTMTTTTTTTMTSMAITKPALATKATAATATLYSLKSTTSHEKRDSREDSHYLGIQHVKTISDNIQICYFPRPLSQHASLHDLYDNNPAAVTV